jgi:hypothetical protein
VGGWWVVSGGGLLWYACKGPSSAVAAAGHGWLPGSPNPPPPPRPAQRSPAVRLVLPVQEAVDLCMVLQQGVGGAGVMRPVRAAKLALALPTRGEQQQQREQRASAHAFLLRRHALPEPFQAKTNFYTTLRYSCAWFHLPLRG